MDEKNQQRLFLIGIFLTGATGLVYQIVWQKYLSLLIGAESRSQALIVAFFLTGLALGYSFFGNKSEKIKSKKNILKYYGYIEILIGLYGILFPKIFDFFFSSSIFESSYFMIDLIMTAILILPPTFCMGATVPLLTKSLPISSDQVNKTHSLIYGLNTLGAFLGTILGGIYFIYEYGLPLTSTFAALINIVVGLIFISNTFEGMISSEKTIPIIDNPYSKYLLGVIVFFSGLYIISLEVLWFRLFALTIGSSNLIFPIVLGLFVLALGIGPLTIKELSTKVFKRNIVYILVLQLILYLIIPYLPLWFSHLRITLKNYPENFLVFYILVFFFLSLILVPPLIYTGRLLPFAYAFLEKKENDYGKKCGHLYFLNTVGTFLGAILIGHLLLHWFNIHHIYQILTLSMVFIICYIFYIERLKKIVAILLVCSIGVITLGGWNRTYHINGIFRERFKTNGHFKGAFRLPPEKIILKDLIYFKDGINTTVAGMKNINLDKRGKKSKTENYTLFVNGKSDGNTLGDYATIHLSALIPYLFHTETQLKVAVIGMGTGVTAGLMAQLKDVSEVDVVEISPSVNECIDRFGNSNYNVLKNSKVKIHLMDAFKFFRGKKDHYDIVISAPTNPWSAGTEQLFTPEFFQAVKHGLKSNGLFIQWAQLYDFSKKNFVTILKNLRDVSYNTQLFLTHGVADSIFLSSVEKISLLKVDKSKFNESIIIKTLDKLGIYNEDMLFFLKYFNNQELRIIEKLSPDVYHSIEYPRLGLEALKSFFVGNHLDLNLLISPYLARNINLVDHIDDHHKQFIDNIEAFKIYKHKCHNNLDIQISCNRGKLFYRAYMDYTHKGDRFIDFTRRISGYKILRKHHYIKKDLKLINEIKKRTLNHKIEKKILLVLIDELVKEGHFNDAKLILSKISNDKVNISEKKNVIGQINIREKYLESLKRI